MNAPLEDCFHLGTKVLLCTNEEKILLLKKQHPIKAPYWDLPGGRLQKGETLLDTLYREVEEETGFKILDGEVPFDTIVTNIRIPTIHGEVGLILSIYRCNIKSSFVPQLSSEHTDFAWFSFSETAQQIRDQYPVSMIEKIARMSSTCVL